MRKGQIGFHSVAKLVVGVVAAIAVLYVLLNLINLAKPPS